MTRSIIGFFVIKHNINDPERSNVFLSEAKDLNGGATHERYTV